MRVLIASSLVLVSGTWLYGQCQKPSVNLKACYQPSNAVGNCNGWTQGDCPNRTIYSINQFPEKAVEDTKLKTHQPQRDCYKYANCIWDATVAQCVAPTNWSPYLQQPKIEENGDCATPTN